MLLQWLCCIGHIAWFAGITWQSYSFVCICVHDVLGEKELAHAESVGLAVCVSKPSVAVCRRKHNNKLLNIWTTIPFLWFSVPLCVRFCVSADLFFALSCFINSVKESGATCFYAVDAHDVVAMNDAHGICLTCHLLVFIFFSWCFFSSASMPIWCTWFLVHTCYSLS